MSSRAGGSRSYIMRRRREDRCCRWTGATCGCQSEWGWRRYLLAMAVVTLHGKQMATKGGGPGGWGGCVRVSLALTANRE